MNGKNAWALRELCGMSQRYNFVAMLVNPKPVAVGYNDMRKSHPMVAEYSSFRKLHAEISCLNKAPEEKVFGATMLVWRRKGDGFGMAKPCDMCEAELRKRGVKEVVYSTEQGFEVMRL